MQRTIPELFAIIGDSIEFFVTAYAAYEIIKKLLSK